MTPPSPASPDTSAPSPSPSKRRRWLRRIGLALAALAGLFAVFAAVLAALAWEGMGAAPRGERLAAMQASPQWDGRRFENPQPMHNDMIGAMLEGFSASDEAVPDGPVPTRSVDPARFDTPPASDLRVTWLGHSIVLIEIEGVTLLTDPVWGPRTAPISWLGPKRWTPPLIALDDLPPVDAVLISHDHYDHLDHVTIKQIADWDTTFIVPLGVGAHLESWGVPAERIRDVDWWDEVEFGDVTVTAVPSRHASGRHLLDQMRTLWCGYAIRGAERSALFSGDTGLFPGLTEVGERLGPFDVTMFEVGAYARSWPDWHLGPEQALRAHEMVGGDVFLPIHWGLFDLSFHSWTEPIERVLVEAERLDIPVATPMPGESFEPATVAPPTRWWPETDWRTVDEYPIEASGVPPR